MWLHPGVILNPHYKDMGNLYGSEFWSYSLPRVAGEAEAQKIARARLPMGAREALELGLADACFKGPRGDFLSHALTGAQELAQSGELSALLEDKRRQRMRDERERPLASYREEELERMKLNFYGFDPSYHIARYNFVSKVPKSRTPVTIARHRDAKGTKRWRNAS